MTIESYNTFIGTQAGAGATGGYNTFIGAGTGWTNKGANNAFLGYHAGYLNDTGNRNTFLGYRSGYNNKTGQTNTFLGSEADVTGPNSASLNNATAIGANAKVSVSNALVLGTTGVNVGIGTDAPQARLHLVSGAANQSGLRLANLTSASPATVLNKTKFLTIDALGNVILASINSTARVGADESDGALWQTRGSHLVNTNTGGVVIGSDIARTPEGYRLYVADGILTEKVQVAVRSTDDWRDKVLAPGYQLRSLKEVAGFVRAHGHLPGIPSAETVVKEGLDVAKMDARLLEKIEELTLYLIRQEDNRIRQDKKIARLEKMIRDQRKPSGYKSPTVKTR
ncbi:bZIP transcription factor [Larkinella soli]|uniref:bZIP transcription factor n=1 Tax=Larkinella soli TaxID=1770527 RepID=UPI001E317A1B|nr:bZIP transcription factor [Larkinella soli]